MEKKQFEVDVEAKNLGLIGCGLIGIGFALASLVLVLPFSLLETFCGLLGIMAIVGGVASIFSAVVKQFNIEIE
jgi:hypothetical protein